MALRSFSTRIISKLTETVVKVEEKSDRILDRLSEACEQADAKVHATIDEAIHLTGKAKRILNKESIDEKTRLADELVKERPSVNNRPKETEPTVVEQEMTRDLV